MIDFAKSVCRKFGIDKAVFFVLLGRGVSFLTQPITIYLIARFFTPQEQGFYYTFANILSLSIFLELGLGVVITQFASHEFAYLHWTPEGALAGESEPLARLVTILRKSLAWYGLLSFLMFLLLTPAGLYFFGSNADSARVTFSLPWILLVLFSALNLAFYPCLTVIEGCGRVADLQKMRLWQAISGALCVWIVIVAKGSLLAAAILAGVNFAVSIVWGLRNFKGLLRQAVRGKDTLPSVAISWREEILPMQWRIALSWIAGYLIYQLFNPLLFRYQGATVAGQMGMSMNIASIALTVSIAWISTKFPTYGTLIQKQEYTELDTVAWRSTCQALFFSVVLSILVFAMVCILKSYFPVYGRRVLSLSAIGALLANNVIMLLITSMAGYLRAHKSEPLLATSVIGAFAIACSAWICARYFSAESMTYSILGVNLLLGFPLTAYVFIRKRSEWHVVPLNTVLSEKNRITA